MLPVAAARSSGNGEQSRERQGKPVLCQGSCSTIPSLFPIPSLLHFFDRLKMSSVAFSEARQQAAKASQANKLKLQLDVCRPLSKQQQQRKAALDKELNPRTIIDIMGYFAKFRFSSQRLLGMCLPRIQYQDLAALQPSQLAKFAENLVDLEVGCSMRIWVCTAVTQPAEGFVPKDSLSGHKQQQLRHSERPMPHSFVSGLQKSCSFNC